MKKHKSTLLFVALGILLFTATYNGLTVRTYDVTSDKLSADESLRIVLLSDLHSASYGYKQSILIDQVRAQKPDLIALPGDLLDRYRSPEPAFELIEGLEGIAPMYFVTGNHEIDGSDDYVRHNVKDVFRSYGVNVLEDEWETVTINGIDLVIGGLEDPLRGFRENIYTDWDAESTAAMQDIAPDETFKVLLSHRAEQVDTYAKLPFDLVLSGHAHGGQVRIPYLMNGLFAPDQGFFPKYAGGLYEHETFTHVIGRGFNYSFNIPRIYNPPEIVVIDVNGQR
ncbi:metallophosphoesterase [Exiguobacterium profundum]|uniref:metallophosphoesterase n=1 Tax=Exiguobacterium profundum TaxID=307643 RepID=UPI0029C5910F|nr:metallophosphoesterase [Exiguobacterium profundum]MDX5982134.1 metallophosphoesterase [Exiguobacterium profundum]